MEEQDQEMQVGAVESRWAMQECGGSLKGMESSQAPGPERHSPG